MSLILDASSFLCLIVFVGVFRLSYGIFRALPVQFDDHFVRHEKQLLSPTDTEKNGAALQKNKKSFMPFAKKTA